MKDQTTTILFTLHAKRTHIPIIPNHTQELKPIPNYNHIPQQQPTEVFDFQRDRQLLQQSPFIRNNANPTNQTSKEFASKPLQTRRSPHNPIPCPLHRDHPFDRIHEITREFWFSISRKQYQQIQLYTLKFQLFGKTPSLQRHPDGQIQPLLVESESQNAVSQFSNPALVSWRFLNIIRECIAQFDRHISWSIIHIHQIINKIADILAWLDAK